MVGVAQLVSLDAPSFVEVEEAPRDDHGVGADVHDVDEEEEDFGELHVDDELDSPNWSHHLLCQVCVAVDGGRLAVALAVLLVVALVGSLMPLRDDSVLLALLVALKRNHHHSLTLRRAMGRVHSSKRFHRQPRGHHCVLEHLEVDLVVEVHDDAKNLKSLKHVNAVFKFRR